VRLNATSASLLGLLADAGETTCADLLRVAQLRIGDFWNLTRSQVYRELGALAMAGYVRAGPPGPREARPYRITRTGREAFGRWLAEESPSNQVRLGLLVLVAFGRYLPPGRLGQLLKEYEEEHRRRLDGYRVLDQHLAAQNADAYTRATLSFGLHYEEAILSWLDSLPDEVRGTTGDEPG
jgi:DNA-binding PadR family transcriptional regulator